MYLQDGQTPLFIASRKGHIAVVQLLLQMFADVSISKKVCHTLCIVLIVHSPFLVSVMYDCTYNNFSMDMYIIHVPQRPCITNAFWKEENGLFIIMSCSMQQYNTCMYYVIGKRQLQL